MSKPSITRTYGQIHFEDLDPKRFEDLIRQLVYDFKDWQNIEATGRGGTDDGFDVRGHEKNFRDGAYSDEDTESEDSYPMQGNEWMIQCKRELSIGPIRIKSIIQENIDPENPPYGYILAVSANISKRTFDAFREELQKVQVMEFYLWGKAALEDMLYLPKNDRILFTFFGISLATRRRSRTTEVRATVIAKNKLITIVGTGSFFKPILLRDINDENYPFDNLYPDFKKQPRWLNVTAFAHHPWGLMFHEHEYYAYIDKEKKEYDYCNFVDIVYDDAETNEEHDVNWKRRQAVISNHELFPFENQGFYVEEAIVNYKDMLVIDAKGDNVNERPHIFVDFIKGSPFSGWINFIRQGNDEVDVIDYKRVKKFPESIELLRHGRIHEGMLQFNEDMLEQFSMGRERYLIAIDDRYREFQVKDIVTSQYNGEPAMYMITSYYTRTVKQFLDSNELADRKEYLRVHLGKIPAGNIKLQIYEIKYVHINELEDGN